MGTKVRRWLGRGQLPSRSHVSHYNYIVLPGRQAPHSRLHSQDKLKFPKARDESDLSAFPLSSTVPSNKKEPTVLNNNVYVKGLWRLQP